MRFEPYDPTIGCLAIRLDSSFVVVCPNGRILSRHTDEAEARNEAMFVNLTATESEKQQWRVQT